MICIFDAPKVNLAALPEALLALLLLARQELCDVGVVALGDVLMPALLDLVLDHVLDVLGLGDAPRAPGTGDSVRKVYDAAKILKLRHKSGGKSCEEA